MAENPPKETKNPDEPSKEQMEKAEHLKRGLEKIMGTRIKDSRLRNNKAAEMENMTEEQKQEVELDHYITQRTGLREQRAARIKIKAADFQLVKVIGKGAFGEVRIVRDKQGKVFAMKTMVKKAMVAKNQVGHIVAERDLMAEADNPWLVKLYYAFQDATYLYLVMEYCGGGDLMGLLIKKDILSDSDTRFYMSELASAIDHVHQLGFVHRDLKPDNVLIANDGHIRLSDFGLAKSFQSLNDKNLGNWQKYVATLRKEDFDQMSKEEDGTGEKGTHLDRKKLFSTVGTPDYIAIEVLYQKGYDKMVDWWSMGVIMFECLVGYAPFHAKDPLATCRKIVRYEKYFKVPPDSKLSKQALDLMKKLVCPAHRRIGFDQIKIHPWFKVNFQNFFFCIHTFDLDFSALQKQTPPFIPNLANPTDARYFDAVESEQDLGKKTTDEAAPYTGVDNRVWGYTFSRADADQVRNMLKQSSSANKEQSIAESTEETNTKDTTET
ncbi:AGC/NDR protein kinase [Reticulomyxa filosa]|uniref:non-specific serine/threonine protein kinase n=1 Tax=Reticulomyxa filosa TaxID=46433 RepID=X6MZ83_RETFI|nr:AGC/NDR protein kinase [Reticulomyxa filosa]|eukprot:ETO18804.1 AGC/NDR protein kinase [Reticulomyxa filosa]